MILDTSFLIDVLRGDESAADVVERLDRSGPLCVSAVTVMELWEGIHLSNSEACERESVQQMLEGLTEVPFDRPSAMMAGELNATFVESGRQIESADVMIAATALVKDEPVVTGNISHFERFDDLEVVSY
jgi:predicted nucleic acid-binding protein